MKELPVHDFIDGFRAALNLKLFINISGVGTNGFYTNVEIGGNFLIP